MTFTKPWRNLPLPAGLETKVPVLDVYLRTSNGRRVREAFVVDSGADISMGPRRLCDLLGLVWESGQSIELQGISPREECTVPGMIHSVEISIREARCRVTIPFCFADGDAPTLLGREGFFDAFRIQFDKRRLITVFELMTA
jgi:hypothetical protein